MRGEKGVGISLTPNFLHYEGARGVPSAPIPEDSKKSVGGKCSEITLKVKGELKLKKVHFAKKNTKRVLLVLC